MEAVHQRVWTRVLEHFVIFPIEADVPGLARPPPPSLPPPLSSSSSKQQQQGFLRDLHHHLLPGVSTIAGLPLPNSGRYRGKSLEEREGGGGGWGENIHKTYKGAVVA